MNPDNHSDLEFLTTGQAAKTLRVSVSTLKRWLRDNPHLVEIRENHNGWRLFTLEDVEQLRQLKNARKRRGKIFHPSTLRPVE